MCLRQIWTDGGHACFRSGKSQYRHEAIPRDRYYSHIGPCANSDYRNTAQSFNSESTIGLGIDMTDESDGKDHEHDPAQFFELIIRVSGHLEKTFWKQSILIKHHACDKSVSHLSHSCERAIHEKKGISPSPPTVTPVIERPPTHGVEETTNKIKMSLCLCFHLSAWPSYGTSFWNSWIPEAGDQL